MIIVSSKFWVAWRSVWLCGQSAIENLVSDQQRFIRRSSAACLVYAVLLTDTTLSGQVRYGGIRRSSASPRPPCDGTPSSSVWPSPRQTPGPPCPYPSDRPQFDNQALMAPSTHVIFISGGDFCTEDERFHISCFVLCAVNSVSVLFDQRQ